METKKILIVDDDIDVITIIQTILKKEGYEVIYANDKVEGMKKIREEKRNFKPADSIHFHSAAEKRPKDAARPAATEEFEQEQTEKTEAEKLCQKCAILGYSTTVERFTHKSIKPQIHKNERKKGGEPVKAGKGRARLEP